MLLFDWMSPLNDGYCTITSSTRWLRGHFLLYNKNFIAMFYLFCLKGKMGAKNVGSPIIQQQKGLAFFAETIIYGLLFFFGNGEIEMNQRDYGFLHDMSDFICLNRLATIMALHQAGAEPETITQASMQALRFPGKTVAQIPAPELAMLIQNNQGNIQGIMTARMYAELFAGYEDLGALGSAIKHRKRGGIFGRYVATQTREPAAFLQEVLDSNIPEHPEVTLDHLLRLPSITQIAGQVGQDILGYLEKYYQEIPKYLYEIAKHYRLRSSEAQAIKAGESPNEWQNSVTGNLAIILGFIPLDESLRDRRLSVDAFNRIKHQFLVTGNLAAYTDQQDTRSLEYALLKRDQEFVEGIIQGVINIARVMSDFSSLLLLLSDHGIEL